MSVCLAVMAQCKVDKSLNSIVLIALLVLIYQTPAWAFERFTLSVDKIQQRHWVIENAEFSLSQLKSETPKLNLQAGVLRLPTVFQDIQALTIQCQDFVMQPGVMACPHGTGVIASSRLASPAFEFSLRADEQGGVLDIKHLKLFGGEVDIKVQENQWRWKAVIKGQGLALQKIQKILKQPAIRSVAGKVTFNVVISGVQQRIKKIQLSGRLRRLNLQTANDKLLTENTAVAIQFSARRKHSSWHGHGQARLDAGAVFFDPVYLDFSPQQPLMLSLQGEYGVSGKQWVINDLLWQQGEALTLQGQITSEQRMQWHVTIDDLNRVAQWYLKPFLEGTVASDLGLAGQLEADLTLHHNQAQAVHIDLKQIDLAQPGNHIQGQHMTGQLHWQKHEPVLPSFLEWRRLQIKKIPIEAGRLDFKLVDKQVALIKPADLKMLDGVFSIKQFSVQGVKNDDTNVFFEGRLNKLSLEKLSDALDWKTPLSGTISGYIPAVHYQNKTLRLDGQLAIQVFGGEIVIKKLSSSGLFSFYPRLYTDIEFENLDLRQITQKFQIGKIEGRLSGFVHDLYLENWKPVTFYAWFGTPDDDDSRHRISQKAVENIASIGGGGAADVISRGFLRFFDTFYYDKLGFGCYLHDGVCQVMGVEAAKNGYYLIKGGGLPRIDVIGYNPRLDWDVLIQRLKRISATDEVVVQ